MRIFAKNEATAAQRRMFFMMIDSSDHLSPLTGLDNDIDVSLCKSDETAYTVISLNTDVPPGRTVGEVGNGTYYVDLLAADLDTEGECILKFAATGADTQYITFLVVASVSGEVTVDTPPVVSGTESTLANTFANIKDTVCFKMAYGQDWDTASTNQQSQVERIVKMGLQQAYWPPAINGRVHRWSFLRPKATISLWPTQTGICTGTTTVTSAGVLVFYPTMIGHSLVAGTSLTSHTITGYTSATQVTVTPTIAPASGEIFTVTADGDYRLPADFGSLDGTMNWAAGTGDAAPILVGEGVIRAKRNSCETTGCPAYVAVMPVARTGEGGQRFELLVYPTPETLRSLVVRYSVLPDFLVDTTREYPYGGAQHAQTIMQSCLAVAEHYMNDTRGIEWTRFLEMLQTSIQLDQATDMPRHVGSLTPTSLRTIGQEFVATYIPA